MRVMAAVFMASGLAGCVVVTPVAQPAPQPGTAAVALPAPTLPPESAARNFIAVVDRVEPVAEAICRERAPGAPCDLQIVVDTQPGQPPNAYQTIDRAGRPIVAFTTALLADARNMDELAFILGHEASHHIRGHLPRQQNNAVTGALLAGVLGSIGGADAATIEQLQNMGATVAARRFSKDYELEADDLGAEIALRAGYDPLRGAKFFDRIPDPGHAFLGTHPPNSQRRAQVAATVARLQ